MKTHRLDAFIHLSCVCRSVHTVSRDQAIEDSGLRRWQCVPCGSRFVIAHLPEEDALLPVFLDDEPATDGTERLGVAREHWDEFAVPSQLRFECRCGSKLVVPSTSYGNTQRCPRCRTRILLKLGHDGDSGKPLPLAEYLDV